MLTVRGLTRSGLEPVDLDLADGEAVAVLGPSGGGKTIFLRAIADLDPNSGSVALDGTDRNTMAAPVWRRQVMFMAAEPAWWAPTAAEHFLNPIADCVLFPSLGLPEAAMEWELAPRSTGERQRLALARTLTRKPRVLLLDEPTSGLDPESTRAVENVLNERLKAGIAILLTTHDREQARRLGVRALWVEGGRIGEQGL